MSVYLIDPISDPRWTPFLEAHPAASVFHSGSWLKALQLTYGYQPMALTTSSPGSQLNNGLAACRVGGWFGNRLVSLPFSDHCEPLVQRSNQRDELFDFLAAAVADGTWKRVELRPRRPYLPADDPGGPLQPGPQYCFHALDLSASTDELYERLHPSCMKRSIRRAAREQLNFEAGTSAAHLSRFYHLLRVTRRRHGLPPQPLAWFENLTACLGENLTIHLASKAGTPIAGMMTLRFKRTLVYKYGCSDARYHRLGPMASLFWRVILDAKNRGLEELDLGRSDMGQPGLIAFKDRLGASRSTLTYFHQPASPFRPAMNLQSHRAVRWLFGHLPDPALSLAGRLLYRRMA